MFKVLFALGNTKPSPSQLPGGNIEEGDNLLDTFTLLNHEMTGARDGNCPYWTWRVKKPKILIYAASTICAHHRRSSRWVEPLCHSLN